MPHSLQAAVASTRDPLQVPPLPAFLGLLPGESKVKVSSSQRSATLQLQGAPWDSLLWVCTETQRASLSYLVSYKDTAPVLIKRGQTYRKDRLSV